ncbi:hypothetical protein IQ251_09390 [Saccharopolyspora sp. HNM0983]|uniref:Uncharacterized protein n=1 Tax=Saccharopolyspora montiporae TaxID=2781240 RepID=A0A929B7J3_9PSEU|nr:hypothetical protein [Saccharopolyspora sp. HNM0983]MBE9374659.1 hypothetical protein [Saccharopolyspora sp. HNM0983]
MPIRTHRGRAAVYRRLWGWPLRSPRHLVVALVVVVGAATVVGLLLPDPPPQQRSPTYTAEPGGDVRAEAPTQPKSPPTLSVPQNAPPPARPSPRGVAVADAWAQRFTAFRPGMDEQRWLDGLRPHTTDEFITEMASVDPANAPSAVTGRPEPGPATSTSMVVRVPTDLGPLRVTVNRTPDGWRVATYDREG